MKYLFVLLCALVALVAVSGQGIPTKQCPPGEHSVFYCPRKAEPDCNNPSVRDRPDASCGIPDCFCDTKPTVTVRDPSTGKCVELSQCPNKTQ